MKIKSIVIEGFHNVGRKTYEFSDLNYLKGPNGSGKSTVLQAIQWALLGYIPGTDKNKTAIFKHSGNHTMAVTLNLDDNGVDVQIQRILSGVSTISSELKVSPENYDITKVVQDLELPIFNFDEFVGMTANKLKDWFINFLPSSDVAIDWPVALQKNIDDKSITADMSDEISTIVSEISSFNLSGLDEIRKTHEYLKTALSFKKSEVTRLENTIKSMVCYDGVDSATSDSDIVAKIAELTILRDNISARQFALDHNNRIEAKLAQYSSLADNVDEDDVIAQHLIEIDNLKSQKESLLEKVDAMNTDLLGFQSRIAEIKGILKGGGICPYTHQTCESVQSQLDSLRVESDNLKVKFDEMYAQRNKLESQRTVLGNNIDTLNNMIADRRRNYSDRARLISELRPIPDSPVANTSIAELDDEIARLQDLRVKIKANAQYESMIDSLTAEKFKLDNAVVAYKSWIDFTGVNGIQSTLASPFTTFCTEMNDYISKLFGSGVTSHFDIQAKANSFSFGICKDNKYIPYNLLSSGEKCMYTLALMLCLVSKSSSPLKVILADDMFDHLDDNNANALFAALTRINDIQMIVAGVKNVSDAEVLKKMNVISTKEVNNVAI